MSQALKRTKVVEVRAAEILRILHRIPDGFGEKISSRRVQDELDSRRVLESQLPYDMKVFENEVLTRTSANHVSMLMKSVEVLLAMGFVRKISKGVYAVTAQGRAEAELWFPELRTGSNNIDVRTMDASAGA